MQQRADIHGKPDEAEGYNHQGLAAFIAERFHD
jgi:hypothetical protein